MQIETKPKGNKVIKNMAGWSKHAIRGSNNPGQDIWISFNKAAFLSLSLSQSEGVAFVLDVYLRFDTKVKKIFE